jgi:membrane-bound ClpP family serine protease
MTDKNDIQGTKIMIVGATLMLTGAILFVGKSGSIGITGFLGIVVGVFLLVIGFT